MLFNSLEFIFAFLPVTFLLYFYLLKIRYVDGAKALLVFSSLFFYSWWNIFYLPIILSSMLFNYVVGNALTGKRIKIHKKTLLIFGIASNISLLCYFKYADFMIGNFNSMFGQSVGMLNLVLPLAISFFTFQQIAYLVDSYKRDVCEYDFLNYSLFVTFFPQLIAGPIVHHSEMMPQFASKSRLIKNYKNISAGIFIFSIGLFKKVIIADALSKWVATGFDSSDTLNIAEAWATSLSYTFQLYFDFSGYTDMAIGIALLFNIRLPNNFNSPYKALDIQDFWRRWHMTLSRFLRDYIYIPLGGNRNGSLKLYTNVLTTFILGGIWHGAGWMFILWGGVHGVALITNQLWKKVGYTMPVILSWFITFNFINFSWVLFRAKDWDDASKVLQGMIRFDSVFTSRKLKDVLENIDGNSETVIYLVVGLSITLLFKNTSSYIDNFDATKKNLCFSLMLFCYSVVSINNASEFLYFNF